ncbi:rhamnulokinase [Poriferisphaera sp. WC338]|uniref:rhamnulokinase n=1 Tax=Poriferisphaera sp. WC338 TaxID=3425129 RepID=UPI003D8176DF
MSTSAKHGHIAFDLGAESGRTMLAVLENNRLQLIEINRFANLPQHLPSGYHWSLLDLWRNLLDGLTKAAQHARENDIQLISLGVDTWGVDFGLLGKSGQLLGLPFAYRDPRNPPAMQAALNKLGDENLYDRTGVQFMPFNSLFQLLAQKAAEPAAIDHATRMLFMPDLLHYFFTNKPANEATIASTSQMIDPRTGQWDTELLEQLGLPTSFLSQTPLQAGSTLGPVTDQIASHCKLDQKIPVILPGSHDTASAIAAVPVDQNSNQNWAYLSSGTWSLMGAELDEPIVNTSAMSAGFTNERGVENKIRFLKNIAGLWLVQEIRRDYESQGQSFDYIQLTQAAAEAKPFQTLIDPADPPFATPGNMLTKITAYAQKTNQPNPASSGAFVRCALESLAFAYRTTLHELQELLGRKMDVLHVVGGGGKNELLQQMTADAINLPVIVGPYEATAIGNALTQAMGAGNLADLAAIRSVVKQSFELKTYKPSDTAGFDQHAMRYQSLITKAE